MNLSPTIVLDCNYLGYQAMYTMRDLKFGDTPTGVTYGFLARLLSLAWMFRTNDIVFCWDSKHSIRRKKHDFYKRHRRTRELTKAERIAMQQTYKQFNTLRREILPAIGFRNVFVQRGCEADDLMAKLVDSCLGDYILVSSDEDLYQLLRPYVRIYNPSAKRMITTRSFRKKYHIRPEQWPLVKAIAGCKSDEVPGVNGVGEVFACRYIRGRLEPKSKVVQKLRTRESEDIIERNLWLVTLPLPATKALELQRNEFDMDGLVSVCTELGMASFLDEERMEQWDGMFHDKFSPVGIEVKQPRRKRWKRSQPT